MDSSIYQTALITDLVAHALNRDLQRVVVVLSDGRTQTAEELRNLISRYSQTFAKALAGGGDCEKPRGSAGGDERVVFCRDRLDITASDGCD
jgi:hypothetical protein